MHVALAAGILVVASAGAALAPRSAAAQDSSAATANTPSSCRTDSARTLSAEYHGRPIESVAIVTAAPPSIAGAPDKIDNLHVRTRRQTVRRNLLFAPGDTVDTLRVAESLRRLRRLRYLSEVGIAVTSCSDRAAIDVAVITRDAWSTAPTVKVRGSSSAVVGLEERNVLGTGRSAKVYVRSDGAQLAFGAAYSDPWVAGSNVAASVARNAYRDGSDWSGTIGLRERSVFDPWRADLTIGNSVRESPALTADTVRRESGALLLGRRVSRSSSGATLLLAGAEYGESRVAAGSRAVIVGPSTIRREFIGADIGVARQAARYGVVPWYLPGGQPVDLPNALEGEVVLGIGRDIALDRPALHADAWLGRFWMPGDRLLVSADAWASGYRLGQQWSAGTLRLALGADAPARRGIWTGRLAAEQLFDPDPDVRALASADVTLPALAPRARLAETALAMSLERDVHLRRLTRGYMLDVAGFAGASMRWDPAAGGERPTVGVLGAGFRLSPSRAGMARLGIDIGFPVLRSGSVGNRPFVAFSVTPWLESSRMRDGRRSR